MSVTIQTTDIPALVKKVDRENPVEWIQLMEKVIPIEKDLPRDDRKLLLDAASESLDLFTKQIEEKRLDRGDKLFLTFLLLLARLSFSYNEAQGRQLHRDMMGFAHKAPKFFMNWYIMERKVKNQTEADRIIKYCEQHQIMNTANFLAKLRPKNGKSPFSSRQTRTPTHNPSTSLCPTPKSSDRLSPRSSNAPDSSSMSLKENADAKNQEQSKIEKKKEENEAGNPPAPVAEKEAGNPPAPVAEKGSVRRLSGPPSTKKKVRRLPPDFGKRANATFNEERERDPEEEPEKNLRVEKESSEKEPEYPKSDSSIDVSSTPLSTAEIARTPPDDEPAKNPSSPKLEALHPQSGGKSSKPNRPPLSPIATVKEKENPPSNNHATQKRSPMTPTESNISPPSRANGESHHHQSDQPQTSSSSSSSSVEISVLTRLNNSIIHVNGTPYFNLGKIGKGGSAGVFRVMNQNFECLALKCVDLRKASQATTEGYINEIKYLRKVEGFRNFVISMIDAEVNYEKNSIRIVLELGEWDLSCYWKQYYRGAPFVKKINEIRLRWQQILEDVDALHSCKIVHRDLKPSNFVLCKGRVKLIDFGIAKEMVDGETNVLCEQAVGTLNYMSPESLSDIGEGQDFKLNRANDVWSLGCILYEMVYGTPPFAQYRTMVAKLTKIRDPMHKIPFPEFIGSEFVDEHLRDVLRKCLEREVGQRASIQEMLEHSFLIGDVNRKKPS